MTRTRKATVAAVSTVGMLLAGVALSVTNGSAQADEGGCSVGGQPIVGAWEMTIDPRPFTAPSGQTIDPPPFSSLVEFQAGGTMTDAVSSVPNSPALAALHADGATNAVGAWRWAGGSVTFTFDRYLTAGGHFVAKQRVTGSATVSNGCSVQDGTATVRFSTNPADDFSTSASLLGAAITVDTYGTRLTP